MAEMCSENWYSFPTTTDGSLTSGPSYISYASLPATAINSIYSMYGCTNHESNPMNRNQVYIASEPMNIEKERKDAVSLLSHYAHHNHYSYEQ